MFEKTCKKYGLDPKKLEYFKKRGILGERAGDGDLERAAAIEFLSAAGLKEEEIVRYFRPETDREEKARILPGASRGVVGKTALHAEVHRQDRLPFVCLARKVKPRENPARK